MFPSEALSLAPPDMVWLTVGALAFDVRVGEAPVFETDGCVAAGLVDVDAAVLDLGDGFVEFPPGVLVDMGDDG
jgi:hypothetical protein